MLDTNYLSLDLTNKQLHIKYNPNLSVETLCKYKNANLFYSIIFDEIYRSDTENIDNLLLAILEIASKQSILTRLSILAKDDFVFKKERNRDLLTFLPCMTSLNCLELNCFCFTDEDCFPPLNQDLKILDLSKSELTTIEPLLPILTTATNITRLNLHNCKFKDTYIVETFLSLYNLEFLDLNSSFNNYICNDKIASLQNLTNLIHLDLGNLIFWNERLIFRNENLASSFSKLSSLQFLNLSNISWNYEAELVSLTDLVDLRYLNLHSCRFSTEVSFAKFHHLEYLDLHCSKFENFDALNLNCKSLRHLDLNRSKFVQTDQLVKTISEFVLLEYLDLSCSMFSSLESAKLFSSLSKLYFLDLHNSMFSTFSSATQFASFNYIRHLDLGWSRFTSMEELKEFCKLTNLEYLNLHWSTFSSFPIEITNLKNLTYLDLFYSEFKTLENMQSFPFLIHLNLGCSELQDSSIFEQLNLQITYLNLGKSKFTHLQIYNSLKKFQNLETLNLSLSNFNDISIAQIKKIFKKLKEIHYNNQSIIQIGWFV